MKSILDPTFRYTPSSQTDVRKTFQRIRRELERAAAIPAARKGSIADVLATSLRAANPH